MPATIVKIPRNTRRSKLNKTLSRLLGQKNQPRLAVKIELSQAQKHYLERLRRAGETLPSYRLGPAGNKSPLA